MNSQKTPLQGKLYIVQKGDTLWSIAEKHLGSGHEWPRIYSFNNSAADQKLGATCIVDPDILQIGSKIRLPILPGQLPISACPKGPPPPNYSFKNKAKSERKSTMVSWNLKDSPPVVFLAPGYKATITLQGALILHSVGKSPYAYVGNKGITKTHQMEAEALIAKLVTGQQPFL